MKKYWHVIGIGIQNNLTYRFNYLTRTLFGFIPLFAMLSLWRTIYAGKGGAISGYTMAQMISYYLLVAVVDVLTAVNEDDWQIAADIRDGNISQFLLKPIDYSGTGCACFSPGASRSWPWPWCRWRSSFSASGSILCCRPTEWPASRFSFRWS